MIVARYVKFNCNQISYVEEGEKKRTTAVYLIATKYDYFYLRLHIIGEQQIKIKFFSVILIMCNLNFMSSYFDVVSRNCERNEIVMAV